jgi:TolA-binding protein
LSYKLEKWDDALGGYEALFASAKMDENRFLAKVGIMRAAYKARKMDKTVQYAQTVVEDHRSSDALKQEANYLLAKSYMSQSRRDEAMAVLKKLAEDPSTSYGAEATYMLIMDSYDSGDFQAVENKVFAFSDAATGQTYWLAKSFIILGDSFVDRGEYAQAKATFESVRDGYTATDDDVLSEVNMRLEKLQNVMASNN